MKPIKSLLSLVEYAREIGPLKLSVAVAEDAEVLQAVEAARQLGITNAILVGNADKIKKAAEEVNVDLANYEIVDCRTSDADSALKAVELASTGQADMLMKGMLHTAAFLRAVLNKEKGLTSKKTLSHSFVHEIKGYDRLIFITDAAFNTYPDLSDKVEIVKNAVDFAHAFGIECPKVAALAAVETVNPKMQATLDAANLAQMARRGQIKGCTIDGPLALDNAVSPLSAKHKGIVSDVAGYADILLAPNIEAGNMLFKSVVYFSQESKTAGLVLGTKCPVILTSRADTAETKLFSIAAAAVAAANK